MAYSNPGTPGSGGGGYNPKTTLDKSPWLDWVTKHPNRQYAAPYDTTIENNPAGPMPPGFKGPVIGIDPSYGNQGLGLHLHGRVGAQQFRDVVRTGQLDPFLQHHYKLLRLWEQRKTDPRFKSITDSWMALNNKQRDLLANPDQPGTVPGGPGNQLPGTPDPNAPAPPAQQTGGTLSDLLKPYDPGMGEIGNSYFRNLNKGLIDMPSFDEMFGSYKKVAENEAQRRTNDLTESLGSRGNRYGSSILGGQQDLSRSLFDDLASKASEYQSGLRQQQFNEFMPFMQDEQSRRAAAMANLYQDYNRAASPSPFLNQANAFYTSFGQPGFIAQ